jgi:hypothetical protein
MRFPSIAALYERARTVLLRFPWPLVTGAIAATAAIIGTNAGHETEELWVRLCLVALLGIPLTFGTAMLAERRRWSGMVHTGVVVAGILVLYWFFWTWPGPEQKHLLLRYLQLSAALHLSVAFLPWWGGGEGPGFWQYNRRLFEGFLRAVLFSAVLFLGLAIALGALDKLFGVDVEGETYARLWFIIAFVVNTWIFLAGVPDTLEELEESESYPRALKVFTQYILTPLVAIYLVILTAYLVKVLVTGTWPNGWIGYLVSSVGAGGILGFLLVHPLRLRQDEGWIRTYSRWLFIGLIPAAAMFLMALWKRVGPYGLTELRFLGLLLGAWLLGIALLYSVRRETGIRIIPVSLAFILLFTAFGPLGSTAMSVRSQANRIREISEAGNLRMTGEAVGEQPILGDTAVREMSEALRFLLERNALGTVRELFGQRAGQLADFNPDRADLVDSVANLVMTSLGQSYVNRYHYNPADYFAFERQPNGNALAISGYDYVVPLNGIDSTTVVVAGDTLKVISDLTRLRQVYLRRGPDTLLVFELLPVAEQLFQLEPAARQNAPVNLSVESVTTRGLLVFDWFSAGRTNGAIKISAWRGDLYLRFVDHPDPANVAPGLEPGR